MFYDYDYKVVALLEWYLYCPMVKDRAIPSTRCDLLKTIAVRSNKVSFQGETTQNALKNIVKLNNLLLQ